MNICVKSTAVAVATAFAALPAAAVTLNPWTISGPGTTSVSQLGADGAVLSYHTTSDYAAPRTFIAEALVTEGGVWNYLWDFTGFHAFYNVTAFLTRTAPGSTETLVSAGPENCCTTPSSGFSYSGTSSVALSVGDVLRFTFGGYNFDSNPTIQGTVTLDTIAPVPVAPAGILLLSALGFAAIGRRATRRPSALT